MLTSLCHIRHCAQRSQSPATLLALAKTTHCSNISVSRLMAFTSGSTDGAFSFRDKSNSSNAGKYDDLHHSPTWVYHPHWLGGCRLCPVLQHHRGFLRASYYHHVHGSACHWRCLIAPFYESNTSASKRASFSSLWNRHDPLGVQLQHQEDDHSPPN